MGLKVLFLTAFLVVLSSSFLSGRGRDGSDETMETEDGTEIQANRKRIGILLDGLAHAQQPSIDDIVESSTTSELSNPKKRVRSGRSAAEETILSLARGIIFRLVLPTEL